jgi:hypothetical protein
MKMKGNDTITTNKEVDVSDCACEEEEEPSSCLRFPFPLEEVWHHIWTYFKKGLVYNFIVYKTSYYNNNK